MRQIRQRQGSYRTSANIRVLGRPSSSAFDRLAILVDNSLEGSDGSHGMVLSHMLVQPLFLVSSVVAFVADISFVALAMFVFVMLFQQRSSHVSGIAHSTIEARFTLVFVPHVTGQGVFGSTFVVAMLASDRFDFFMHCFYMLF